MSEKIIAYKAMDKNMMCRGKQYEVGKTYHEDKADCCHAGMHACENPLDVLRYGVKRACCCLQSVQWVQQSADLRAGRAAIPSAEHLPTSC